MLKLFNRKKKDNKGFTLVELVIVVAILAILVGLLAPQYTKYVEKSRKAADASNLEEIVRAINVVASDPQYSIPVGTFTIILKHGGDATIGFSETADASAAATTNNTWKDGLKELLGGDWADDGTGLKNTKLTLKSSKWVNGTGTDAIGEAHDIGASVAIAANGKTTVTYSPTTLKDGIN